MEVGHVLMPAKKRVGKAAEERAAERVAHYRRGNKEAWKQRAELMRVNTAEKGVARSMQSMREVEGSVRNREQALKDYFDKGLDRLGVAFDELVSEQISAARGGD